MMKSQKSHVWCILILISKRAAQYKPLNSMFFMNNTMICDVTFFRIKLLVIVKYIQQYSLVHIIFLFKYSNGLAALRIIIYHYREIICNYRNKNIRHSYYLLLLSSIRKRTILRLRFNHIICILCMHVLHLRHNNIVYDNIFYTWPPI